MSPRAAAVFTLLVSSIAPAGLAADVRSEPVVRLEPSADDLAIAREDWFGIYAGEDKLGYLRTAIAPGTDGGEHYLIETEMHLKVVTLGDRREVRSIESLRFAPGEPYEILSGQSILLQGPYRQEILLERHGDGYRARIEAADSSRTLAVPGLDYTLADFLTPEIWLSRARQPGDRLAARSFTLADLESGVDTYTVMAVHETVADGVPVRYYEVELHSSVAGALGTARFESDGRMVSGTIAGTFELRRESAELARDFDYSADVYLLGMAGVDQPLGDPESIRRLVLAVEGGDPTVIPSFYRQSLVRDETSGRWTLRLGEGYGAPQLATASEIEESLAESVNHPIRDEAIQVLAWEAVEEAESPLDRVGALVAFVDEFLVDSYSAEPLTVLDMLTTRKGDCTEHALLFTTLARAVGLPAREVTGLLYMGDDTQAFGGHAWNEVVVDGHWLPVDATWGELEINATHIRLGPRTGHDASAEALFADYEFELIELEREPGTGGSSGR